MFGLKLFLVHEKMYCLEISNNFYRLTDEIFKGEYGSEEENRLESELDNLMDQKQRIQTAEYKWTNARQLLATAVSQLNMGCKKWADIIKIMYVLEYPFCLALGL